MDQRNVYEEMIARCKEQGILLDAHSLIYADRAVDYGCPYLMLLRYAAVAQRVFGLPTLPTIGQASMFMIGIKLARLEVTPTHLDSYKDIAGYVGVLDKATEIRWVLQNQKELAAYLAEHALEDPEVIDGKVVEGKSSDIHHPDNRAMVLEEAVTEQKPVFLPGKVMDPSIFGPQTKPPIFGGPTDPIGGQISDAPKTAPLTELMQAVDNPQDPQGITK